MNEQCNQFFAAFWREGESEREKIVTWFVTLCAIRRISYSWRQVPIVFQGACIYSLAPLKIFLAPYYFIYLLLLLLLLLLLFYGLTSIVPYKATDQFIIRRWGQFYHKEEGLTLWSLLHQILLLKLIIGNSYNFNFLTEIIDIYFVKNLKWLWNNLKYCAFYTNTISNPNDKLDMLAKGAKSNWSYFNNLEVIII